MRYVEERGDWLEFFVLVPRVIDGKVRWLVPAWRRKLEVRETLDSGERRYHTQRTQYAIKEQ